MPGISRYAQFMVVETQADLPTTAQQGDLAYCADSWIAFNYNGTAWVPSSRVQVKKAGSTIDAKVVGSSIIYTLEPSSLKFYPIMVVPRNVNISGAVTPPTVSIGTNATSYNNIAAGALLPTLLATLSVGSGQPQMVQASTGLAGGSVIRANVTIGAVATTYQVRYEVIGFYDN